MRGQECCPLMLASSRWDSALQGCVQTGFTKRSQTLCAFSGIVLEQKANLHFIGALREGNPKKINNLKHAAYLFGLPNPGLGLKVLKIRAAIRFWSTYFLLNKGCFQYLRVVFVAIFKYCFEFACWYFNFWSPSTPSRNSAICFTLFTNFLALFF